ncbi:MAG TPA: THUMP domain-containing protein, partial [Candidatus Nanoarchaeia archaeon]|nr:THUMP domain-containing protein [Candidatus Nanoarchaeia archaeon]
MKLLLLTKDNIPFARGEAETLLGNGTLDENILLIDTKKTTDRLACTRVIAEVLFEATEKNIEQKMKAFNWNKIVKKTFAVTFRDDEQMSQSLSKHYGGIIYDLLKNPKVKLDNPGANIFIFRTKKKLYVTKFEWENTENFLIRNQKTWPAQRP